jgi:hypothetical protein
MSKRCQKFVKKLSKSCQKVVKKLSKVVKTLSNVVKSCQKVVKKLSNSCQKVKLSQKVVTIGPSNPKLEKPASSHPVKTQKLEWSCQKEETTKKEDDERRRVMKKLGIRRLDATSSHLVTKRVQLLEKHLERITSPTINCLSKGVNVLFQRGQFFFNIVHTLLIDFFWPQHHKTNLSICLIQQWLDNG